MLSLFWDVLRGGCNGKFVAILMYQGGERSLRIFLGNLTSPEIRVILQLYFWGMQGQQVLTCIVLFFVLLFFSYCTPQIGWGIQNTWVQQCLGPCPLNAKLLETVNSIKLWPIFTQPIVLHQMFLPVTLAVYI